MSGSDFSIFRDSGALMGCLPLLTGGRTNQLLGCQKNPQSTYLHILSLPTVLDTFMPSGF